MCLPPLLLLFVSIAFLFLFNMKILSHALSFVFCYVFFFQAEDGIRDDLVTGVQTCALPISPTLNSIPDRGVRYAASFDDETPQIVTLVPAGWKAGREGQRDWEKSVADNAHFGRSKHRILAPGYHTLKIWMVDPAVVMQKLIVDLGGLKPSYLGPPESFRGPAFARPAADQPVMRSDRNSQLAHAQLLAKAKAGGISLYFLADSITRRWGGTHYPDFLAPRNRSSH